ncbi:MAG TPA: 3-hydroxyacyl-CoA dehydrogenase family protein [Thermoleophilaceae bacterium]|nr:3-hydroxyacyl-CoA dehydrogenase family protein [Thermoleophilaceae bacterium]
MKLGIAGSGAIACGLARAATESHEVVLWARSETSRDRACSKVEDAVTVVTELSELGGCPVVVEAISEDVGTKRELYGLLADVLDDDAVLATTTSSLSVAELAEASGRPDRFGALHVFNPVDRMKLVELSFPDEATPETRDRLKALCDELGKTAVEVPDAPGFVVNKLLFPYLFDAVRLLERDGLEPEAIDTCMKLGAGHPMGPLALLDYVGLDVSAAIGESIGADVPERVHELIEQGKLGKKSGAGFYEYPPKA